MLTESLIRGNFFAKFLKTRILENCVPRKFGAVQYGRHFARVLPAQGQCVWEFVCEGVVCVEVCVGGECVHGGVCGESVFGGGVCVGVYVGEECVCERSLCGGGVGGVCV